MAHERQREKQERMTRRNQQRMARSDHKPYLTSTTAGFLENSQTSHDLPVLVHLILYIQAH